MTSKPLFLVFIFLLLVCPTCSATTVSLSDLHLIQYQKYDIYQISPEGYSTCLGEFNSTDTFTMDPAYDYHIVLKPSRLDWFQSVPTTINYMMSTDGGQFIMFLAFFMIFGGAFMAFFNRMW